MTAFQGFPDGVPLSAAQQRRARRRRRPKRPQFFRGFEVRIFRLLNRLVRANRERINAQLLPILPRLIQLARVNLDDERFDVDRWAEQAKRVFSTLRDETISDEAAQGLFEDIGRELSGRHKSDIESRIENALALNEGEFIRAPETQVDEVTRAFAVENAALIRSLQNEQLNKVEGAVIRGVQGGKTVSEITRDITKATGIDRKRAALIATDQTQKLRGSLERQRQSNLGIDRFIWRTQNDERVRESHRNLEGRIFKWTTGARVDGQRIFPGSEINCRCYAEPVVER